MGLFEALAARNGIKELKETGGAGYTDAKTLTYDGNKEGKDVFVDPNGVEFVRIGNAIDIHTITKIKMNGTEFDASELVLGSAGGADFVSYSGDIGVYVFPDDKNNNSPSGTYVWDYGGYVITRIETETVYHIDQKYLSKVVDLNAFTTTDDTSFNMELLYLAMASAQSGGTLQTKTVHDSGNALRTACSTNRQLLIVSSTGSAAMTLPACGGIEYGEAVCVTFVGLVIVGTVNCELKAILQFRGTDEVDLYVKATPLA